MEYDPIRCGVTPGLAVVQARKFIKRQGGPYPPGTVAEQVAEMIASRPPPNPSTMLVEIVARVRSQYHGAGILDKPARGGSRVRRDADEAL